MIEGKSNIPMQLGVYAQTLFAVSAMVRSLTRSSSMEIAFTITDLAKLLSRDYKNVHTDVKALDRLGLLIRAEHGEILVPWETVIAEMRLAA